MSRRDLAIQICLVLVVALILISVVHSAQTNLNALGMTAGFDFLNRSTGWGYSFSLIERTIDDSYARTLTIGFLNTLFVGSGSIVFATILGFVVGTMRDSHNPGIKAIAGLYIQFFRNIPLILQVVFLYAVLIHFPSPKQALSLFDKVFMSNRGISVPIPSLELDIVLVVVLASLLTGIVIWKCTTKTAHFVALWLLASVLFLATAIVIFTPADSPLISVPELKGLRFRGGLTLSVEIVAMIVGIVLYGAAYIGEVVRGGLAQVLKGLTEAGESLGLGGFAIWWTIRVPMALRSIIPPLGNQWLFIMKGTTVGVAIGFSDLFYIVSTAINQSGRTLELLAILVGAFLLINFAMARFVNTLNKKLMLKGYGHD